MQAFLNLCQKGHIEKTLLMGLRGVILFKISLKKLPEETENCHCEKYTKAS